MTVTRTTATSRRAFLRSAGAFPAFWSLARTAGADDEALFRLVRREFPFHDDRAPMNAANLCPLAAGGGGPGERTHPRH